MSRILVLGGGGREHALCWKLAQSASAEAIFCAPGNAGTAEIAENVALAIEDALAVIEFARAKHIDLVVIGPEAPLVAGVADQCDTAGIAVLGAKQAAARLESSKAFTRALCDEANIPGARWKLCDELAVAQGVVRDWGVPIVIKADGLAAGKGVVVAKTEHQALQALENMMAQRCFGAAGAQVVIEECLSGQEASLFVLCDGHHAVPMGLARDHKPIGENDTGANTGGMGCFTPIGHDDAIIDEAMKTVIEPALQTLRARGTPFRGILFAGLMLTGQTAQSPVETRLIEFNVRFGDPECQAMMMHLDSDPLPLFLAAAQGHLNQISPPRWRHEAVVNVVLAAPGYPGNYPNGLLLPEPPKGSDNLMFFHAGTTRDQRGNLYSTGGRVLNVCACGDSLKTARQVAYTAISNYRWQAGYYRRDIAGNM